ncbi:MAG: ATP-binding protein [Treponema sp.]|nr:ATP-binding protein [Treponema sp.]
MNIFEKQLYEKTKDTNSELLFNQWKLVKENIPDVLSVINNLFPHYSLHDSTHSESILINIHKILGNAEVSKFSSIDIWLLVNCAYLHDIGMVLYAEDAKSLFSDEKFIAFINEIKTNNSDLTEFANFFEIKKKKIYFSDNAVSIEKIEALKFLMAEFVRKEHSNRAKEFISESSYFSAYNIPLRIIKILSKICDVHTKDFDEVLKLPLIEDGISFEDCHPRFIACLLRLGDVLDLDNNRISPILSKTISTIPADSFFHRKKHFSITHKEINTSIVEVSAVCEEYRTAELASAWFDWINQEFTNQMKNWKQIVPVDYSFSLPTIGKLDVKLKDYESFDGKKQPTFSISSEKALELLQGAGIYKDKYQCFREIIQNAIDATYLRIWKEKKEELLGDDSREKFYKECKNYPIKIFLKKEDLTDSATEQVIHIEIIDNGLGMSKADIQFLGKTGTSSKNIEKKAIIEKMPEWMKPSGTFGIGFQSIFQLVDKVKIETRKLNSVTSYSLDCFTTSYPHNGEIYIKKFEDEDLKIGTKLSIDYKCKKEPFSWSYSSNEVFTRNVITNYDFIENESFDVEYGKILDGIIEASGKSVVPITIQSDFGKMPFEGLKINSFDYFSKDTNLEISLFPRFYGLSVFYRNQPVRTKNISIRFLDLSVNILSQNADEVLSINRNEIKNNYSSVLFDNIVRTMKEYLKSNPEKIMSNNELVIGLSAFFKVNNIPIDELDERIKTSWKKYTVFFKENGDSIEKSIDEILNLGKYFKLIKTNTANSEFELFTIENDIVTCKVQFMSNTFVLLQSILSEYYKYISYTNDGILFSKDDANLSPIDSNAWKDWFLKIYRNNYYARNIMPCNKEYEKLALKDDFISPFASDCTFNYIQFPYDKMICPFIYKTDENGTSFFESSISDKFIQKVYENRKSTETTEVEIRNGYEGFIKKMQPIVEKINNELKDDKNN